MDSALDKGYKVMLMVYLKLSGKTEKMNSSSLLMSTSSGNISSAVSVSFAFFIPAWIVPRGQSCTPPPGQVIPTHSKGHLQLR